MIVTGYRSNICVLHTAVTAAWEHKYRVVIPVDGLAARTEYEQEYTLAHFRVLPDRAARLITITQFDLICFSG